MRLNRDSVTAILLLLMCGVFIAATFTIRETSYGTIGSEFWPRIILAAMTVVCLIYLVNSLRLAPGLATVPESASQRGGLNRFFHEHLNAFICFFAFAAFVATLPYLGMLIGGTLFVFGTLTLSSQPALRAIGMTTGLGVVLGFLLAPTALLLVGHASEEPQRGGAGSSDGSDSPRRVG